VLAAGGSTRMGRPKPLLPAGSDGGTFVARVVRTLDEAGVHPVVVVTRADLAASLTLSAPRARVVVNHEADRGQLSSLLVGLDALEPCEALVVTLVDIPFVAPETVRALVDRWKETRAPLVRPLYEGRHGHPAILDRSIVQALREADLGAGAKPVLRRFAAAALSVDVKDPAVAFDIDTPEEYVRALERFGTPGVR